MPRSYFHAISLLAALILPAFAGGAPQIGTWGDQGDGSYRNPILNADYPDVDIEKLDDTWYLITSTNTYAPGMTICESKDLVNWTLVGQMWDTLDWNPDYNWDVMGSYGLGVWAADLAHHDGTWYCYFVDTHAGLYVSHAKDIAGPWTPPALLIEKQRWTDPCVYWDEDLKQAFLLVNWGTGPDYTGNQARLFKMSWDGLGLEDEGTPIYYGGGAEAAKIYKIDGTYYVFISEWIEGDRKQIVLRGKDLYGPLARKIIMERSGDSDRSVCQGALLQAPDGSWWLTHQLVQHRGHAAGQRGGTAGATTEQSFEGRSQWLVPIKWKDGWPSVPNDPDGNGIGSTVEAWRKPVAGFPIAAPQTDDEFDGNNLSPQWQWNHNPRDEYWSLSERPGWLRLKAAVPVNDGGFWNAANTISQRLMGMGPGEAICKIDISGMAPGQGAGFCFHSGKYTLAGITVEQDGTRRLFSDYDGTQQLAQEIKEDIIYFCFKNDGRKANMSFSLDGRVWEHFGPRFELTFGKWRGSRPGFFCWNEREPKGHIDIDWFHYTYDGPKAETPTPVTSASSR